MSNPRPELPLGLKWSFEFDPTTLAYIPRFAPSSPDGVSLVTEDALSTIDWVHREIHEGNTYQVTTYTGSVANNDSWSLMISLTGTAKNAHTVWEFAAGGDAEVRFYENVTGSSYGTQIVSHNMDHVSHNVSEVQVFMNPTITVYNTIVFNVLLPGGSGGTAGGGTFRQGTEHILASGQRYLLQVFNRAGTAKPMSIGVQWYEEDIG